MIDHVRIHNEFSKNLIPIMLVERAMFLVIAHTNLSLYYF